MQTPEQSVVHGSKANPKDLPSTDRLLRSPDGVRLIELHGHTLVAAEARGLLDQLRERVVAGELTATDVALEVVASQLGRRIESRTARRMRRVLNLTGTVIHTNLGRAVIADAAIEHAAAVMRAANNLEFNLESGDRGDRDSIVESLLCELTGAEAATVVNNNAAAVLLTIAALARGREVVVSRGELVEIGGAFRMPDVMASAGAAMVEVGTTNRTHLADYERAIGPRTALLMKVHTSNYAITGFTSAVAEADLSALAKQHGVPLATDLGSGSLVALEKYGLPHEPTPQEMIAAGCDVVTFSGDKLLGGPQAGLIVGRKEFITRIRKFPMKRALRMSKLPLAALEATLRLYLKPELLTRDLPTLRHLTRSQDDVRRIAQGLQPGLATAIAPNYEVTVAEVQSQIGSGSLPVDRIASAALSIGVASKQGKRSPGSAIATLASALRALPVPVIGRVQEDRLLLDCRCLDDPAAFADQFAVLRDSLAAGGGASAS